MRSAGRRSQEPRRDRKEAFAAGGFILSADGDIRPRVLDNLDGADLSDALRSYVRRAKRGIEDAALGIGTGKDLLEATASHVIRERFGAYAQQASFPMLLGQAFVAVGLATPQTPHEPNEPAQRDVDRSLYQLGCAVNRLRNKEGTGHGRPWLPNVTSSSARCAVESMGVISEYLLQALGAQR